MHLDALGSVFRVCRELAVGVTVRARTQTWCYIVQYTWAMSKQSNDELTARVAELEEQVRVLRELIDSFVRVDKETLDVTLTPNFVRCEVMTVHQAWTDEDEEYHERDRIVLFVDEDKETATVRLLNESEEVAYDIEACDEFVATEHYQDGRLRLRSRAESGWASYDTVHFDGKRVAARIYADQTCSQLIVNRADGSVATSVGLENGVAASAVWDSKGSYPLVRIANTGDDMGSIDGFRSRDMRWLQLNEIERGRGGRICMWAETARNSSDFSITVDPEMCTMALGQDGRGDPAITLFANDRARQIAVSNFLGKVAAALYVDAAGNCRVLPNE